MRSGVIFGAASVLLAWILTSVAVAAPLTDAWRGFDGLWTSVRDSMEGTFGSLTNPNSRISGDSFGQGFTVQGEWISADDEALTLAASRPLYLRTATYDRYTGRGFDRSDATARQVPAGDLLFEDAIPERPSEIDAFELETIAIRMHQTIGRNVFTAGAPLRVYAPVIVHETGGAPVLGGLDAISPLDEGQGYQVAVAISEATAAQLMAAGEEYPEVVRDLYLDAPGLTDRVAGLAAELTAGLATPYEKAAALARFLHSNDQFTYAVSAPAPGPDQDLVDFFLFDPAGRTGYCQYYASAMVVMARSLGIPARVAVGFAPGERQEDGTYLVREENAHAWAEVYFPGYGWQIFEPTKTINPQFTRVTGDPDAARPPRLDDPLRDFEFEDIRAQGPTALPSFAPAPGAIDPANPDAAEEEAAREGNALVIAVLVLGAATYIFIRFRHLQRRWQLLPAGDRAWQRLAMAADRAGVGPRPSETIYEYAGWLEDQLPRHVEPIRTVADGKVWQAYSGRRMNLLASDRLERAWARLRLPLLWLAVRRWLRGLVGRGR
jgi:transglutaminase-like putative cysteine protease